MESDKFINNKCLYYTLVFLSIGVGLFGLSLRQISSLWGDPFTWKEREVPARIHFITGPLVLIAGVFQFNQNLRKEKPNVHRWLGRIYVFFMLISIGSIFGIVMHAAYGLVPQISLLILNILWLLSLLIAVYYIAIKQDVTEHKYWMVRNYALTCSAITLRIINFIFLSLGQEVAYKIATSNCFIWNIILAEVIIFKLKQMKRQKQTPPDSIIQVVNSKLDQDLQKITKKQNQKILNV